MSKRVYLPSENAMGLDMPDRRYDVPYKGAGYVDVDDLHGDVLDQYTGLQVGIRFTSASHAKGVVCSNCGREEYKALAGPLCKRCGGDWEPDEKGPKTEPVDEGRRRKVYNV